MFFTENKLTFVYNNRVRVYELETGKMIINKHKMDAKSLSYSGEDVTHKFVRR